MKTAERLQPVSISRQVGWTIDRKSGKRIPAERTYLIGHGQQLAARRLNPLFQTELLQDRSVISRQEARALARPQIKADAKAAQRLADAEVLANMRDTRSKASLPKRHPGNTLSSRRPYAKPHGQADRSILMSRIDTVPALTTKVGRKTVVLVPERAYETTFHATKGHRRHRVCA